jgi:hypothetical protein
MKTPEEREEYYRKQLEADLRDHPAAVLPGMFLVILVAIAILATCQGWTYPIEGTQP